MIPVLSRAEMRAFDANAIGAVGVPSLVLMENAGRGAADVISERLGRQSPGGRIAVVCGSGNNGGDGFVAARHLLTRGHVVDLYVAVPTVSIKGDARVHYDALAALGATIHPVATDQPQLSRELQSAALVVDALLGTGLDRPVAGVLAAYIDAMQRARGRVVSLDVPSGMNADTGEPMGAAVEARCTVTFGFRKLGLMTPRGAALAGEVLVADIGVPPVLGADVAYSATLLEPCDVARSLTPRGVGAHKGTAGHVAVFAGSRGKVGAALLSSRSALRAGAGLVTLATWTDALGAIEGHVAEVMTEPLDRGDLPARVDEILRGKRSIVIGPGFGTDSDARAVVEHVLSTWRGPMVVDADALAIFAGRPEVFASAVGKLVLTPHPGELAKLLSRKTEEVEGDRFGVVREATARTGAVVVLKGAHTLIGARGERTVINASGSPALATAGAGDVLSGVLGGLLLSGLSPFDAAWCAVYLHGRAADLWSAERGDRGLLAHEVADRLPDAVRALTRAHGLCPV